MKGIIIKDLKTAFNGGLITAFLAVAISLLCLVISFLAPEADFSVMGAVILTSMLWLFNMTNTLTFGNSDEQSGWETFCGTLPLRESTVVASRYLSELILLGGSCLLLLAYQLLSLALCGSDLVPYFHLALVIFSLLLYTVCNPLVYKFGAQKAGYIISAVFIGGGMAVGAVGKLLTGPAEEMSDNELLAAIPSQGVIIGVLLAVLATCTLLFWLSFILSRHIYSGKEF